jgi:hypothetical protein
MSVQWNERDALFIQFIENQQPPHVSRTTCSSTGGAPQTALGILRAYNVSWLSQLTLYVCAAPPEDEQVILETCTGSWFSINWMKIASRWFHYADILWCTVSKILSQSKSIWLSVFREYLMPQCDGNVTSLPQSASPHFSSHAVLHSQQANSSVCDYCRIRDVQEYGTRCGHWILRRTGENGKVTLHKD